MWTCCTPPASACWPHRSAASSSTRWSCRPIRLHLLSDEHFTVDGTLIEAAANLKSFRPKDDPPSEGGGSSGDNPANRWVDFHGEQRSNATHQSHTDPDARLYKKRMGQAAKLCYVGHAVMENRHGLLADFQVTTESGTAECALLPPLLDRLRKRRFHPKTVGLDRGYDTRDWLLSCAPSGSRHMSRRTPVVGGVPFHSNGCAR
jgi:hypothetical protein